jgi:hypothetical protein
MIKFTNVKLAYREGLPLFLKGINFEINPGEKVMLFDCYYTFIDYILDWYCWPDKCREKFFSLSTSAVIMAFTILMYSGSDQHYLMISTVELHDGKFEIDGLDISQIDLNVLRSRLALVPQDTTLFLGTLWDNLCGSFYSH